MSRIRSPIFVGMVGLRPGQPGWGPADSQGQADMTPDKLASMRGALYGERWQIWIPAGPHVADCRMRRWLASETPIPDGLKSELREVLQKRSNDFAGMIRPFREPRPSDGRYPAAACFKREEYGNPTLSIRRWSRRIKSHWSVRGAIEALRQKHERDPRIKLL